MDRAEQRTGDAGLGVAGGEPDIIASNGCGEGMGGDTCGSPVEIEAHGCQYFLAEQSLLVLGILQIEEGIIGKRAPFQFVDQSLEVCFHHPKHLRNFFGGGPRLETVKQRIIRTLCISIPLGLLPHQSDYLG